MLESPLVSVVMPVYNHERFVAEAIRSVFAQTWRPIELIIIDDGSQDGSAEVVRETLKDCPDDVTISFRSRENRGAHATINEGLSEARGTWLTILNSDDVYDPARLQRCLKELQERQARLLISYVDPIDNDGVPLSAGHIWWLWYSALILKELDQAPTLSALLLRENIGVSTGNLIFKRSLYEQLGNFADFRYAHDLDFLLRACLTDEPVMLREPLYRYRLHTSNTITESKHAAQREKAVITAQYLRRTLAGEATNPFAPRLDNWPHSFMSLGLPPHLSRALDSLIEGGGSMTDGEEEISKPTRSLPSLPGDAPEVTLISHEMSHTGAPVLLRDIARELRKIGAGSRVISLVNGPMAKAFEAEGCPVVKENIISRLLIRIAGRLTRMVEPFRLFHRPVGRLAWLLRAVASRLRVLDFVRKGNGVLLLNSFASWPLGLSVLSRWRGTAFWYIHETYDPTVLMRDQHSYERLQSLRDRGAVRMLYGSNATREVWARAGFDGDVFYWSGLPINPSNAPKTPVPEVGESENRRRVVLSVQSAGTRKGTRELVEAFAYGRREGLIADDAELCIVGCPKPSVSVFARDLLVRINQDDLRGAVRLVAVLPPAELDAYYQSATIYVQSSIMECLPLALLTAMAHSLPIVSSDADGCREAIQHENTGLLVPQRQISVMAEAISRLLNEPEEAHHYGENARQRFEERFSLEATVPPLFETLFAKQLPSTAQEPLAEMVATARR